MSRRRLTMKNSPKIGSSAFGRIIGVTMCPNGSKTAVARVKRELPNFARAGEGSSKFEGLFRRNRPGSRRYARWSTARTFYQGVFAIQAALCPKAGPRYPSRIADVRRRRSQWRFRLRGNHEHGVDDAGVASDPGLCPGPLPGGYAGGHGFLQRRFSEAGLESGWGMGHLHLSRGQE
jgi:hypothetical protein